jgi:hypothetical protein
MIFIIISIILLAALIYLTIAASMKPKKLRLFRTANTIVGAVGIALTLGSYLIATLSINSATNEKEWAAWARDMFVGFFNLALPVFLVLFSIIVLSSIISMADKKSRGVFSVKLRTITPIAVSALLLIIAYFYAPATANQTLPLDIFIYIAGIGTALAMRLTYTAEYTVQMMAKDRKSEK